MSGSARRLHRLPVVIFVAGLAVFLVVAIACRSLFNENEQRLLQQRTNEAGLVLTSSIGSIRAPLDAAAALAAATNGDPADFEQLLGASVGDGKAFSSAALYRIGDTTPLATSGGELRLAAKGTAQVKDLLDRSMAVPFRIVDLLAGTPRRLGYAVHDAGKTPAYVVYAELTLSDNPNVRRRNEQPFSGLDYAIYLGDSTSGQHLLGASLQDLPITGRTARVSVPFGDTTLLLVMTPQGHLGGEVFASLWWLVLAVGAVFSLVVAWLSHRLLVRRDSALDLADDNARLYADQRAIAESLQLSLLPQHFDAPPGAEVTVRYWPAGSASLIGGDFYDVFQVDDHRWGIMIGDVCGKGVEAAGLTGLARHTVRAAARHERLASGVLHAVHIGLADQRPATFCTACFIYATPDIDGSLSLDLSLGGHPQPILRRRSGKVEAVGVPGTLLGMVTPSLSDTTLRVEDGDTLVLYTDGLTDAPGAQAVSVEQVIALMEEIGAEPIERIADDIGAMKRSNRPTGSSDDTALVVIRFGVSTPVEPALVAATAASSAD